MTDNMTDCSYIPPAPPTLPFLDSALSGINDKLTAGKRLELRDGLACLATTDLAGLGALAHGVRTAKHGLKATYVSNQHLNYTNICVNKMPLLRLPPRHRPGRGLPAHSGAGDRTDHPNPG